MNFKEAYAVINEQENSIQIACVGNSDLYSAFSPPDLWNKYGFTSTVCATARQTTEESYYLLQKLFQSQKPALVILETDMFFDKNPKEKNKIRIQDLAADLGNRLKPTYIKQDLKSIFSLMNRSNQKPINTHGYRFSTKICKLDYSEYMIQTEKREKISAENLGFLNEILRLCAENTADVLLVEMPSISSWNYERHNSVMDYAKANNLHFIDFNLMYRQIGIMPQYCFRDKGNHLNYYGACAVTDYIGSFIKVHYKPDSLKSNSNYKNWNDEVLYF